MEWTERGRGWNVRRGLGFRGDRKQRVGDSGRRGD